MGLSTRVVNSVMKGTNKMSVCFVGEVQTSHFFGNVSEAFGAWCLVLGAWYVGEACLVLPLKRQRSQLYVKKQTIEVHA